MQKRINELKTHYTTVPITVINDPENDCEKLGKIVYQAYLDQHPECEDKRGLTSEP